jgi:hypothetical protein
MIKRAVSLLHGSNAEVAVDFYYNRRGFRLEFSDGPAGVEADPCYMGSRAMGRR